MFGLTAASLEELSILYGDGVLMQVFYFKIKILEAR